MLQEVEVGHVATVITKDLSRLGRNYLKTGELIEVIFPEYDVRYIAINDGVDTAREDTIRCSTSSCMTYHAPFLGFAGRMPGH